MASAHELAIVLLAEDKTSKGLKSAETGMSSFGKAAAAAGAVAGAALGAVALSSVSAASDVAESQSKVNTVFGDSAKAISDFSSTSATALGIPKAAALDAAGSFGNLFDQLGIGRGVSADMSTSMLKLAADLGSFHNADITQVIDAQSAAFRGEYDSLQRFIPTINAAAVEEEALRATKKKTTKDLTDQDKALAVHALMMKGAGAATGDFARTSDGLANSQRIVAAQMADLKVEIGQALMPVVESLIPLVRNAVKAFTGLPGPVKTAIAAAAGIAAALVAVGVVVGPIIAVLGPLAGAIGAVGGAAVTIGPILGGIATAIGLLSNPIGWLVLAVAGIAVAFKVFPGLAKTVGDAVGAVGSALGGITATIKGVAGQVPTALGGIVTSIVGWATNAAKSVANAAYSVGLAVVQGIGQGIGNAVDWLNGVIRAAVSGLPQIVQDALGISSPSKVFADKVGLPIVEGVAAGIGKGMPGLNNTLAAMATVPPVTATGRALGSAAAGGSMALAGAGGGSGAPVINVRVQIGQRELRDVYVEAQQAAREAGVARY